jgi:predicted peptidase
MKRMFALSFLLLLVQLVHAQNQQRFLTSVFTNIDTVKNLQYGAAKSFADTTEKLLLDIYSPSADTLKKRPLIVFVHGGGFVGGDKAIGYPPLFCYGLAQKGYVVASINYRLGIAKPKSDANYFEAMYKGVQDAKAAIRFCKKNAGTYGIDSSMVFVMGASAGGMIALQLAYLDPAEIPDSIDVSVLGTLEGVRDNDGYSSAVKGVINCWGAMIDYRWMRAGDIPVFNVHGIADKTVPVDSSYSYHGFKYGSKVLYEHAKSLGIATGIELFENTGHTLDNNKTKQTGALEAVASWMFKQFFDTGFSQKVWTSKHVEFNKDSTLTYIPDAHGNTLPDFSRVGCYQNAKPLPIVPVVKTIEAVGENSQQVIQKAIDQVAMMPIGKDGFRGTILLKKGIYKIPGTINIAVSGIVLRGEGDETKLIAIGKGKRSLVDVNGVGNLKEIKRTRQKIIDKYVPLGAKSFTIKSAVGLRVGDSIVVFRPGTQKWIDDLKMNQIEARDSTSKQWIPAEYDFHFERVIAGIQGNTIFIDNPIVMAIEDQYGGGEIYKYVFDGRLKNVGIENLLCQSEFNGDTDEDHGWDAVHVNKTENSWIKNITSLYFGFGCVNLGKQSRNITVTNCNSLDAKSKIEGGRRYSFNNDGQMNLFMNCFATEGRHDYATGAQVRGPNVFYNCIAQKAHNDIGPHHRWAMGTLYDNIISDGPMNAQDRGNWGTGHGWAGVNQIFWNCTASRFAVQQPWVSGNNYAIGMKGIKYEGRLRGRLDADIEGMNQPGLLPASLYMAQLKANFKTSK